MNKNADPDKYEYSGYDTGFGAHSSFPNGEVSKNVVLGADMSFLRNIDTRKKNTLIFYEYSAQGLDDATILVDD